LAIVGTPSSGPTILTYAAVQFSGSTIGDVFTRRIALETIGFTRLALAMATACHLRAVLGYASHYQMGDAARECREGVARIDRWVEEVSEDVGGIPTVS
jgi:hypothetical protein